MGEKDEKIGQQGGRLKSFLVRAIHVHLSHVKGRHQAGSGSGGTKTMKMDQQLEAGHQSHRRRKAESS